MKPSKKQRLREYLEERRPTIIGEAEWRELETLLAPISENYLRELLHASDVPVAQPFDGVRQSSFEALASSLMEMEKVYATAGRELALRCRRLVIQAKDRARLVSRNPKVAGEKRAQKREMVEWMLVWLENPGVFPVWAQLRLAKQKLDREGAEGAARKDNLSTN